MTNKKTPDGNQELEPIWTNNKVAAHADALYETYRKLNEENREQFLGVLLKDFCVLDLICRFFFDLDFFFLISDFFFLLTACFLLRAIYIKLIKAFYCTFVK